MFVILTYFIIILILFYPIFCEMFFYLVCFLYFLIFLWTFFQKNNYILIQYDFVKIKNCLLTGLKKIKASLKSFYILHNNFFKPYYKYTIILRWKSLFKKTSYFGLYRANRVRWLNKTEENINNF